MPARDSPMRREQRAYLFVLPQPAGLFEHLFEIGAIFAIRQPGREFAQLFQGEKSLAEGGLLRAADFHALALFNRLYVGGSFVQAAAGAGIEPRKASAEAMHVQFSLAEVFDVRI